MKYYIQRKYDDYCSWLVSSYKTQYSDFSHYVAHKRETKVFDEPVAQKIVAREMKRFPGFEFELEAA